MHVLFATAEVAPLVAVGGLAQASAGLVAELRRQGVDVTLVLPDYGGIELTGETIRAVPVPAWAGPAGVRSGVHNAVGQISLVRAPGTRAQPSLPATERGGMAGQRPAVPDLLTGRGGDGGS